MLNMCTKCVVETARSRQTSRMVQIQTLGRLAVTGWRGDSEHGKGRTLVQAELMTGVGLQSCQNIYSIKCVPAQETGNWESQ